MKMAALSLGMSRHFFVCQSFHGCGAGAPNRKETGMKAAQNKGSKSASAERRRAGSLVTAVQATRFHHLAGWRCRWVTKKITATCFAAMGSMYCSQDELWG
jgi:hypothetical protein